MRTAHFLRGDIVRAIKCLLITAIVVSVSSCQNQPIVIKQEPKLNLTQVVDEILATPEGQISLRKYAVMLSKCYDPSVNTEVEMRRFDIMADSVRPRLKGVTDPKEIVAILNKYIFEEMKFRRWVGDATIEYTLLPRVLGNREGTCLGIGMVYLCLAERLSLPVFGVFVPEHFFMRYDNGKTQLNIEPTKEGKSISDEDYLKQKAPLVKDKASAIKYNFLRNLSKKEALAGYLHSGIGLPLCTWGNIPNLELAVEYCDNAIKLFPNYHGLYSTKGGTFLSITIIKGDKNYYYKAIEEFLKAYQIYPHDAKNIAALAVCYYKVSDYQDCLKTLEELEKKFSVEDIIKQVPKFLHPFLSAAKSACLEQLKEKK